MIKKFLESRLAGQVPYHYFTCLKILLGIILLALLSLTVCVVCIRFVLAHRLLLFTSVQSLSTIEVTRDSKGCC